jgi:hypothetical protein
VKTWITENMSLESESQGRNSESTLEHDDDMSDGITNMDITILEDGDELINYNGMDEHNTQDFNVAATLTLKKNLNDAFEKHAEEVKETGVKAKIQAFEQVNMDQKFSGPKNLVKNANKVRFEAPSSRPPTVPVTKASANNSFDDSLLSVYLRVRPTTASKEALKQEQDALHNTVEIFPAGENESGDEDPVITRIRTYPPIQSNTSKSNRGQNHFYASSSASSGSNDQKAVECAVKGVKEFQFSQVFGPESSQEELYKSTAVPLVEGLFPKPNANFFAGDRITGHSALLFSYGITNAGKTFTMMGNGSKLNSSSDKANAKIQKFHGIIPRTIDHILEKIDELNSQSKSNGVRYSLNMSHLEIYNEDIYDLLPQKKTSAGSNKYGRCLGTFDTENKKLQLRDLRNGNIHVKGLTKHRVTNLLQGLELSQAAKKKRQTSSNNINADSSRSHSICQFELHATRDINGSNDGNGSKEENSSIATDEASGYGTDDDSIMSITSKPKTVRFWVVDLAGSERSKRTGAFSRSTRQKEASLINSSLMNLMTCLRALRQNQSSNSSRSMVPFRDSKLTHLFMGHLTGHSASRTRMIVNVNPSVADFDETQHVLAYAADARSVRIDQMEFNKKRQEIQPTNIQMIHTHGADGHSLKSRTKSPPRKIAKIVSKLSPRAALARRRVQQVRRKKGEVKTAGGVVKEKPKIRLAGTKRKLAEDEMKGMHKELEKTHLKVARYQTEVSNLKDQLEHCETDIRGVLAEETAEQIQYMREQHEVIVKRLKQQVQNAAQTPSKSAKKAKLDRADLIIEELMDKIEEGEEEMERMRDEYQHEIRELSKVHAAKLNEHDSSAEALFAEHAKEIAARNEEIDRLRVKLEKDTSFTDDGSEEDGSDLSFENEDEDLEFDENASTPSLKRLPRGRCSEVACGTISPPKENASSTKKSRGLRLRSKASPFKVLSANKKVSRASTVDDIIYPSSQAEIDEDGVFKKPRGRAPQGRKWDSEAGGWKLSILS